MKKQKFLWLAIPAVAVATSLSHASSLGLDDDPLGSRTGGNVGYAIFDTFSDSVPGAPSGPLVFTNLAPAESGGAGFITATTSATMTGGSVTGGGDRIYNGNAGASVPFNISVSANVFSDINNVVFQIKYTLGDPEVMNLSNYKDFFTVTLNGNAASPTEFLAPTEDNGIPLVNGQPFGVVKWSWSNLGLKAGDTISIAFTSPAEGHVSLDSFSVDASPVPEPHEYALGMALLLGLVILIRRRRMAVA